MKENDNREIVFFGRITAGFTHEMKNVLAIIKESSGLMEDLMGLSRDPGMPNADRMLSALTTVKEQIQRGVDLTVHLNRFAHEPDEAVKTVDLAEQIAHLFTLSERFARLRNVRLKIDAPDRPIRMETRAVQLQMLLFTGIECGLQIMEGGGEICLRPRERNGKHRIQILYQSRDLAETRFSAFFDGSEHWRMLCETARCLGGGATLDAPARCVSIDLPEKLPG